MSKIILGILIIILVILIFLLFWIVVLSIALFFFGRKSRVVKEISPKGEPG